MESTILNDRYRIVELVGTGGMATVYRGHDLLLDRPVAIKVLREPYASDPAFRDRFLEEGRAAARLDHPSIVHIYDVGTYNDQPYLVMEMVKGEDLKTLIHREGPLAVSQALKLARQICAGVGSAHRAGIVHCDLKPQNILVTAEGEVKVADFGIARAFQQEQPKEEKEQFVWGSPHYISPEQAAGEAPVPASDVYSIGVILYEMLTGVPPFHSEDPNELVIKHLRETPLPMSSLNPRIPPQLEWLVSKVLSKERTNRYRNADQFGIAIEEYMRQGEELTIIQPVAPSITPPPSAKLPPHPESLAGVPHPAHPAGQNAEPENEATGPDWLLLVLLGVAAVAVLGLIPLWWYVYHVYTTPVLPTTSGTVQPTSTTTPAGELIGVPNLMGLSAPDAQKLVESYTLRLAILGEREATDSLPGTILEQTPGAGTQVPISTTINVVLAAGKAFTLPDLNGYQASQIVPNLEAQGLIIVQETIWSTEAQGNILSQDPAASSEVKAGNTLTLTLSGGPNYPIPLQVNLNGLMMLEEAVVPQGTFKPGDIVPVTLRWRALRTVDQSYTVFVHLFTDDLSTLAGQHDSIPVNGLSPTNAWKTGEIIVDPHQVKIASDAASGTYQIRVGLYSSDGRLQIIDSGRTQVTDNSILVTRVEIAP